MPGARVGVFGSRDTGRARPFSDLDLLFIQPRLSTWAQRADLHDAFESSSLPFKVDMVEADSLPEAMAARAHAQALVLPCAVAFATKRHCKLRHWSGRAGLLLLRP